MARYTIGFEQMGVDLDTVNSGSCTTCPVCSEHRKQHNKKTKVFWLSTETGNYKCHHCNIEDRVDSDEWITEQHEKQNKPLPVPKPRPKQTKAPEPIKPFYTHPLTTKTLGYLKGRGISKETAEKLKISNNQGVIAFNYYQDGKIVNSKYRKMDVKFMWQHKGGKPVLYNLDNLKGQKQIILTEGEFDTAAIVEAGFLNCGSIAQGAPNAGSEVGKKLDCLSNSIESIKDAKRVILFVDNDKNGEYLQKVLIERFGSDRCATVSIPSELKDKATGKVCKDANAVLINYGKEKLVELIRSAVDTPIAGVRTLNQARGKMLEIFHKGFRKGVSTEVSDLEGVFSFYKGWWYLWHGIPNSGKSAFVNFLMMCMSVHHGWKWAVFSPEHYPEEDFYIDMVEILTGKSTDIESRNKLNLEEFNIAMDFVHEHFFFVYPEEDGISNTSSNVLDKIKELKLKWGIDGYLIDPYNQLMREGTENIDVYLSRTLSEVDHMNKTHNLVGNIVAHPTKMYKELGQEDYKKSTTYEVAGGAMWYNKCYGSTNVHRPYNQSDKRNCLVEIDVQKIKSHKRAGKPACRSMNFDAKTGWYRSLDGSCSMEGVFDDILTSKGLEVLPKLEPVNTEGMSFTEKMEAEQRPKDKDGDFLPF